jgi:hypothetical protein
MPTIIVLKKTIYHITNRYDQAGEFMGPISVLKNNCSSVFPTLTLAISSLITPTNLHAALNVNSEVLVALLMKLITSLFPILVREQYSVPASESSTSRENVVCEPDGLQLVSAVTVMVETGSVMAAVDPGRVISSVTVAVEAGSVISFIIVCGGCWECGVVRNCDHSTHSRFR